MQFMEMEAVKKS